VVGKCTYMKFVILTKTWIFKSEDLTKHAFFEGNSYFGYKSKNHDLSKFKKSDFLNSFLKFDCFPTVLR
jgi:hypothetical protein